MTPAAHPRRRHRQHLPGRRRLRRRGRPAAAAARAAGRGAGRRFRHPRARPDLRPARRLRGGHPGRRGPARRAARHALRPRAATDEPPGPEDAGPSIEAHGLDPVKVLRLAAAMGGRVDRLLLVGCEPDAARRGGRHAGRAERAGPGGRGRGGRPRRVARRAAPPRRGRSRRVESTSFPRRRLEHVETDIRASRPLSRRRATTGEAPHPPRRSAPAGIPGLLVAGVVVGRAGRPGVVLPRPRPEAVHEDPQHVTTAIGDACTSYRSP